MGNLIWIIGFIIAGIVIVIARAIVHFISKTSQNNTIAKIKNDPSKAAEFISHLDIMLERKSDIDELKFNLIKAKIQSSTDIGNYRILHSQEINPRQFLFFTELSFEYFDVIYRTQQWMLVRKRITTSFFSITTRTTN